MTHSEFDILFEKTIERLRELGKTKGQEYANSTTDRLANFKEIAQEIGVSPLHVLLCYSKKHSRAIDSYCKTGNSLSNESIESRIIDRILYDFLLLGLVEDAKGASSLLIKSGLKETTCYEGKEHNFIGINNSSSKMYCYTCGLAEYDNGGIS